MEKVAKCIFLLMFFTPVFGKICDDETQYEKEGICCKMCNPGTWMALDNCDKPVCQECAENEFMDFYNSKAECKRQPYCDKNLNFEVPVSPSLTKYRPCTCKAGYHCSSQDCFTCLPHTVCKPGERVIIPGNATADTVCGPCQLGTFSNQTSVDACRPWTKCSSGAFEKVPGTNTSDRECGDGRLHYFLIPTCFIIFFALVLVIFYKKRGQLKKLLLCSQMKQADQEPTAYQPCIQQRPEESDETPDHLTDNNNPVAQEEGKKEHMPTRETHAM